MASGMRILRMISSTGVHARGHVQDARGANHRLEADATFAPLCTAQRSA